MIDKNKYEGIGERLMMRKANGYTTSQVGDYLGMDQSHYSKIEHGKRRLRHLRELCNLYICTEDFILYW